MTQTLLTLIQQSRSLSEADKKRLADQLPAMNAEELQRLENILTKEIGLAARINDGYESEAEALNKEYQDTITEFNTHTIKTIRVFAEEKKRQEDLTKADEMLGSL